MPASSRARAEAKGRLALPFSAGFDACTAHAAARDACATAHHAAARRGPRFATAHYTGWTGSRGHPAAGYACAARQSGGYRSGADGEGKEGREEELGRARLTRRSLG